MSYAIPGNDLTPEKKEQYRCQVSEACVRRGLECGLAQHRPDLRIRDLSSADLGLLSWSTPELKENTWVRWINVTSPSHGIIGIYKCLQLSMEPKVSSLSFWAGGSRVAQFELESCYGGLPILSNLKKLLLDPEAREVLKTLSGKEGEKAEPVLCSQMEAWFTEPIMLSPSYLFWADVLSHQDAPPDYLVLGGFIIESRGQTIS